MKKNILLSLVICMIIFAITTIFAGCENIGTKSPSDTIKALYMSGNEGKYSEAEKYFSSETLEVMKSGFGALAGGMKGMMDEATRKGTIEKIEILNEEVRGEGATVNFIIHFKDGKTKKEDEPLIKENGVWKVTIG